MAPERKDFVREAVQDLRRDNPGLTLGEIAEKVGLPGKQWVHYYLKTPVNGRKSNKR